MDNSGIVDAFMMDDTAVHRLPMGERDIHRRFGLRICNYGSIQSAAGSYATTQPRSFEFYCLSHCYEGSGRFWSAKEDRERNLTAGDCTIITPGLLNRYGGETEPYIEDTVCFVGPVADRLHSSGIIRTGVVAFGLARRLLPIIESAADPTVDSQLRANMDLERLLFDIYQAGREDAPFTHAAVLDSLLGQIKSDTTRWWRVEDMAAYCHLSRDQFRRVFKAHTGMSPKRYIDRLRCTRAASLLASTHLSVADISAQVGYTDPYHFSRRFKAIVHVSPSQYRQRFMLP